MPTDPAPYVRAGVLILVLAFGGLGGWSAIAPLASAVVATGQVKVEARRKVIQHLEGGIVVEILVTDGDAVEANQTLLRLSDVSPSAQLRIVRLQLNAARILEARLVAERESPEQVAFPQDILAEARTDAEIQHMLDAETRFFTARRESLASEREILTRRTEQLRQQRIGLQGLIKAQENRIGLYQGEADEWQRLFDAKLADKLRLLQVRRELAELEGENASSEAKLAEVGVAISEAEGQLVLREQKEMAEVAALLRETQTQIADLSTRVVALEDTLSRTEVRTPVEGIVVGQQIRTVGAVIGPGEPLMEIVPDSDQLVVVANISPVDIDSIHIGQSADIRFTAFNFSNTLVTIGEVVNISADAMQDPESGLQFYEAEVIVDPAGLEQLQAQGNVLIPGMPAEVLIKTGGRTLLNYLVKPFTDMLARAFREK